MDWSPRTHKVKRLINDNKVIAIIIVIIILTIIIKYNGFMIRFPNILNKPPESGRGQKKVA